MSSGRILIADDQPHAVRVIRLALSRQGYTVETAGDGKEALDKLRLAPFDVVITDLDMPRMTGQELCEAIATQMDEPKPLVLVVTGTTEPEARSWVSQLSNTRSWRSP